MASSTSSSSLSKRELDADEKILKSLLDAFGSKFPLEDIASAFCQAGKKAEMTGQILYRVQKSNRRGEMYTDQEEISEITSESSNSSANFEPSSTNGDANSAASKIRSNPVSMGSVSAFYQKSYPMTSALSNALRPAKSEMRWVVKHSARNSSPNPDVSQHIEYENFLFKMLQYGFQVIRQVLGECGFDMKKSLEKLIDLAAENHYSKLQLNEGKVSERNQSVGTERTSLVSRNVVVELLKDEDEESKIKRLILPQNDNYEQDDDYNILRKSVKEFRVTMNDYYKAAAEAFSKGDRARSMTLLEKGEIFYRKAREADEESANQIFSSSVDDEEVIPLNLQNCTPKEAVRLVKSHLRYFSGIASVKYLQIMNGADEEGDSRRGSRIRMVMRFLKSESIEWRKDDGDEEDSGRILVRLDEIDPQCLSFAQNTLSF